jgi:hypothetical protein
MQVTTNTQPSPTRPSDPDNAKLPFGVWTAGLVSRTLFILILSVTTIHVASPQNETIWSAYETPGDLIRMVVGFLLCLWLVVNLFIPPKDSQGYWTWIYLAPLVPLALLCAVVTW